MIFRTLKFLIVLGIPISISAAESSEVVAQRTSFEYLYIEESIKGYVSMAEVVAIVRFEEISTLEKQIARGDTYSNSSMASFEILEVLKGEVEIGDEFSLEIEDANVRYLDTDFSIAAYKELATTAVREEIARNLADFQRFEEMNESGAISDRMLERLEVAFEETYNSALAKARAIAGSVQVRTRMSHPISTPERLVMIGSGDVCLVLLSRVENSFGEPGVNSYKLFPTDAYSLYKGLEEAYIRGLLEEMQQ